MTRPRTRARLLAPLLVAGLLAAGCGASIEPGTETAATRLTITNCGQEITYAPPQRALAYDISGAEKLFALGLADRMRGYVLNSVADPSIAGSPWRDDYTRVERLGTGRVTREIVVDSGADFVLAGWGSGFSEERGITPALLDQLGVASYLHSETCFNYGPTPTDIPPMEGVYTDLRNLGAIFGVPDRADALVSELQGRMTELEAARPSGDPARVFVYDSGTDQPYTSGRHGAPHDIIAAAGGRNVASDLDDRWTSVGWENIVDANPEVIVISDYADQPAEDKIAFLESFPPLANSPAVQQDRYLVMSVGDLVSGPRNVAAAERLAEYLRSIGR
jgi:iron complex transport system substrate-binding protein